MFYYPLFLNVNLKQKTQGFKEGIIRQHQETKRKLVVHRKAKEA